MRNNVAILYLFLIGLFACTNKSKEICAFSSELQSKNEVIFKSYSQLINCQEELINKKEIKVLILDFSNETEPIHLDSIYEIINSLRVNNLLLSVKNLSIPLSRSNYNFKDIRKLIVITDTLRSADFSVFKNLENLEINIYKDTIENELELPENIIKLSLNWNYNTIPSKILTLKHIKYITLKSKSLKQLTSEQILFFKKLEAVDISDTRFGELARMKDKNTIGLIKQMTEDSCKVLW